MDDCLVSIITPSFKSKDFIKDTINSVYHQVYSNFEMIIVDDFSSDKSADYIESILPDERFKLIRLEKNIGAAEARNIAIGKAQGRYIAFLDSDDLWYPEKLEKQIKFMQNNELAFSYTSYDLINESGDKLNKVVKSVTSINFNGYMKNTIIGCLTVMIDRSKVKPFLMPNLRSSHDMALWGDIMKNNDIKAYGMSDVLSSYRLVSTSNTANKKKAAKEVWNVYREYFKFNFIKSSWFFINYAIHAILKRL
ncbi:glycosyltransferase family 2 protein [Photobacterium damselae subsp. damselae]|nr:glycosyltransferase family 2 protein [Photobacterium damselae subsp. damselae]